MAAIKHRLPYYVALMAALVYALTLSRGTTLASLPLAANVAGWDWQPMLDQPLTWLLTLPLRALPAGWIPVGLNIFFAVCGSLTLGLLARSVELLPWDCLPEENRRWIKSLPVLLACGVCCLEFNFWQEATAASGAMLDQLLLAAAIWCLLEFRAGKDLRWLNAAALIWGLGMAQTWVLLLNLPLFVAALIWLRGWRFFQWPFVRQVALFGLAGFSIYAVLPIVNGFNPHSTLSHGQAWLAALKGTRHMFALLYSTFWGQHRLMTFVVLMFFLAPILPGVVHLTDCGSNNTSQAERFQLRIYRAARGALLLACLWLVFQPSIGPQQTLLRQFGVSLPLLSFAYLNALGIGFLMGNLLFVSQVPSEPGRLRGLARNLDIWRRRSVPHLVAVATGIILAGLAARNAPAIFSGNRQPLENFGELAVNSLPAGGGIVLGDDAGKLAAVQAALARHHEGRRWQTVHLPSLPSPDYRAALEREQPRGWMNDQTRHELKPVEQFRLFELLARTNRIFFLQPEPGRILFEQFYPSPTGAVAELKLYEPRQSSGPALPASALDDVEKFWDDAWLKKMAALRPPETHRPSLWFRLGEKLSRRFYLPPVPVPQTILLRQWYSISLNDWGVELQRSGRLPAAQRRFEQAQGLNTNNLLAAVNLECNTNLQAGNKFNLARVGELAARFKDLSQLTQLFNDCGQADEPALCFLLGRYCQMTGFPRQAVQGLERAKALAPAELPPDFALAEIYSRYRQDDKVFDLVKRLRMSLASLPTNEVGQAALEVDLLEARSWMSQTNAAKAQGILQSILTRHPDDPAAANLVLGAYMNLGDFTNALQLVTRRLASEPDNLEWLNNQAGILLLLDQASNAIAILDRALAVTNAPTLRLNRARAYFQNHDLPAAAAEYHQLENEPVDAFRVHFGLANIAEQTHDTNLAIHHFEICLTNLPPASSEQAQLRAHLDALKKSVRPDPAAK
jgi:tetratricopeptide (TPR) repeat protein